MFSKSVNYWRIRDNCHYTGKYRDAAHSICNLKLNVFNEIPVVFHYCSSYDYHFIIKELPNEFEGNFECLGKVQNLSTKLQNFFHTNIKRSYKN